MHALQTSGSPIIRRPKLPHEGRSNALLGSLSPSAFDALATNLRFHDIFPRTTLWKDDDADAVYFPLYGAVSVIHAMPGTGPDDSSRRIEVALIGRESVVIAAEATHGMTWTDGRIAKISGSAFAAACVRHPEIAEMMKKAADWQLLQARVRVACNARHTLDRRLARWLITMAARVGGFAIHVTQEDIGETLLGIRRTSVTLAMKGFRAEGMLSYRRGVIRILDIARLRAAACECHQVLCPPP